WQSSREWTLGDSPNQLRVSEVSAGNGPTADLRMPEASMRAKLWWDSFAGSLVVRFGQRYRDDLLIVPHENMPICICRRRPADDAQLAANRRFVRRVDEVGSTHFVIAVGRETPDDQIAPIV